MRNVYEVLRTKELDLRRVRIEVEALRLIAPLLAEREEHVIRETEVSWPAPPPKNKWPLRVDESPQPYLKS